MIHYYLLTAFRHIRSNKLFSVISVAGLSLACTATILIGLYVRDELTYEHWLPDFESIYRISSGNPARPSPAGPANLGKFIAAEFPQIEPVTRLFLSPPSRVTSGDTTYNAGITWVDSNFFELFRLPVLHGSLDGALDRPDSLVLTATQAIRFFGRVNVLGEVLLVDDAHPMTVTAVIDDLPSNTHLNISILGPSHAEFSYAAAQDALPLDMFAGRSFSTVTYVKLGREDSAEEMAARFPDMLDRRAAPMPNGGAVSGSYDVHMTSLDDIHLLTVDGNNIARDLSNVLTVSAIGLLILVGACANYVNLVTAMGVGRARDVGIRKSLGADRSILILQSLTETFIYILSSTVLALALSAALLPYYNRFLDRGIGLAPQSDPTLLVILAISVILLTIAAGIYPAVSMARRSAIPVLASKNPSSTDRLREVLIFAQFAILITLLFGTLVIHRQVSFGIDEAIRQEGDPVVLLGSRCDEPLRNALGSLPGVMRIACSNVIPQRGTNFAAPLTIASDSSRRTVTRYASLDQGYFDLYDIELVAGRSFDRSIAGDHSPSDNIWQRPEAIVINETASRLLQFESPADAIGNIANWRRLFRPGVFTPPHAAEIIGVVEDFQIGSVRDEIPPAAFFMDSTLGQAISIRIQGETLPETLADIDEVWETHGDPRPVARFFYDEIIESMYIEIMDQGQLLALLVAIAVLIAVLGMIGLAIFAARSRTKEMGIRKALGSSRGGIISLLLMQFSKPIILASLLAWPVAFYSSTVWLEGFSRRIELQPGMFILCSLVALGVAMATVFAHAYGISKAHPVKALRYE